MGDVHEIKSGALISAKKAPDGEPTIGQVRKLIDVEVDKYKDLTEQKIVEQQIILIERGIRQAAIVENKLTRECLINKALFRLSQLQEIIDDHFDDIEK